MRRPTPTLLAALCLGLAQGCADRVAGGTTETDNMLAARTFAVDSLLAVADIVPGATTIATLRLDASDVAFRETSPRGTDLAVETLDSVPLPFRIVYWDRDASLGRIQVRIAPYLQGHDRRIRLRWGLPDSLRQDSAAVWKGISDTQRRALTSVLVSDFEQNSLLSLLPNPSAWYTATGESTAVSAPLLSPSGSGRGGHALSITYTAPIHKGFALAGILLGPGLHNLRSLDSIEVWARGTNTILTIAFEHQGSSVKKAWAPVYPDSTWKRFALRPSDLEPPSSGGNVGWLGVRDSITNLSFFAAQGSELWLDDVRLFGIDAGDLR